VSGCGCGCGGLSKGPSAFVRPRFFEGQLLTEEDLTLLIDYTTGKQKLHNRLMFGPGVVCGMEVDCDPCGGGSVAVLPGYALDCQGNDLVLSCKEKVDVGALVRELRVSSMGVDCGDDCDEDGSRRYGLFVRYEEQSIDPVAPYATEEPCPTPGCVPSRIREGLRFLVKCEPTDDHRYNPGTRLLAGVGDPKRFAHVRQLGRRLGLYLDPMFAALADQDRPIAFTGADAIRFTENLEALRQSANEAPTPAVARKLTENVRALASAIARFDTHPQAGQEELLTKFSDLAQVGAARQELGQVCARLAALDPEEVWPDPTRRGLAAAVVAETEARVVPDSPETGMSLERRLLAQGTPMTNVLHAQFRVDLVELREWLLGRLERAPGVADCSLRSDVRSADLPRPVPIPDPDPDQRLTTPELDHLAVAAEKLTIALERFVADAACSALNPSCNDCSDSDVLLAHLELDGCDVVRVCSATREQVLPGGSAYGEWLPKLYRLRELAERVCCQPIRTHRERTSSSGESSGEPVAHPYVAHLLDEWKRVGALEQMLSLLLTPAPGETPPKVLHEQVYTVPSDVTDSLRELNVLRDQVTDLTATVTALRGALDAAREQVGELREQLPERLGSRLAELESTPRSEPRSEPAPAEPAPEPAPAKPPPARRPRASGRTQKPRPGESS
jgi:hypothetical protein